MNLFNIGSGSGMVLSGNKPLPEPKLTKFYDTTDITRLQWLKVDFMLYFMINITGMYLCKTDINSLRPSDAYMRR